MFNWIKRKKKVAQNTAPTDTSENAKEPLQVGINANADAALIDKMVAIARSVGELNEKIEGGLKAVGVDVPDDDQLSGKTVMQLVKMEQLLAQACAAILERADQLDQEACKDEKAEKIMLADYYRKMVASVQANPKIGMKSVTHCNTKEKAASRREVLSGAALALGAVAAVGGAAVATSSKARADMTGAGDTAIVAAITQFQTTFVAKAKTEYAQIIKTIQEIQSLFNALSTINNAIIGGVDALLGLTHENETKNLFIQTAIADQELNQEQENHRARIRQASKVGSGACVSDTQKKVDDALSKTEMAAAKAVPKKRAGEKLTGEGDSAKLNSASGLVGQAVDDIQNQKTEALSGVKVNAPISNDEEGIANAKKSFLYTMAEPSGVIYENLLNMSNTPSGRLYVAEITSRVARRGVAESVIARIQQGLVKDEQASEYIKQNLQHIITATPKDRDEKGNLVEAQKDERLTAHAQALMKELGSITGGKGISRIEALEFAVATKDTSSFYEFVRSSGPEAAPLLRELIEQNSIMLKLQFEQYKASREHSALLALLLCELQDSPDRIARLNRLKKGEA